MNVKLLLTLALLVVAIAAAVHFTVDPSSSLRTDLSPHDTRLAATFQIFRTPTETPSQAETQRINEGLDIYRASRVLNAQLAHTDQGPLWVFHTARVACISHIRGMACARKRQAMQEGVSLGVFDPPDKHRRGMHNFLVQGIAPDDVSQVQVLVNNRRALTVDVKENVFSVAADKPIHIKRLLRNRT